MQLTFLTPEEKMSWTAFVKEHKGSIFSYAGYLDATADNWAVLYNADKTAGIACPFTVKAGQKILYTPFFNRYIEWIGSAINPDELIAALKNQFNVADFNFNQVVAGYEQLNHQYVAVNTLKLNNLANRTLKKAQVFTTTTQTNAPGLMPLITEELAQRVKTLNAFTLPKLSNLLTEFKEKGLVQIDLFENDEWKGGLWLIETADKVVYLKGTVQQEAMKKGGMYRLMYDAILYAHASEKLFDFGGSNVDNVARFNSYFGAKSMPYAHITWNEAPFWWKLLKKINDKWKGK